MAALKYFSFSPKILNNLNSLQCKRFLICCRSLSYQSKYYDNPDPAPTFLKKEVQQLLKSLTRVDLNKVYRRRKTGEKLLDLPVYKFMTNEQLKQAQDEVKNKVDDLLQIPPVVAVAKQTKRVISNDPALKGLDTSKFIFTDISYGIKDSQRLIVERTEDGVLQEVDYDVKQRLNQIYFPKPHRNLRVPKMFEDEHLENILKRGDFLFILDLACVQFEPDNPLYQKVVSITYQWVNENGHFDDLRSTRHFGSFVFFLAWNKDIDNLLIDILNTGHIGEVNDLINLYGQCHNIKFESDGNLKSLEEYIGKYSHKKGALELAMQAYKDLSRKKQELEEGIRTAHGFS